MGIVFTRKRSGRRTKTVRLLQFKPPQMLPCLFGSDCMCINAYIMVFAAQCVLSDLCAESCDSWLLPLVYWLPFPPSCEAASGCQPSGELEATDVFNKCLWVRGSQVTASSHGRAQKCTLAHRHVLYSRHLILRRIDSHPPPDKCCGLLAWRVLLHPHMSSFNLFLSSPLKWTAEFSRFSCSVPAAVFWHPTTSQLNHIKMVKCSYWKSC